jgi:hypothetical protein
MVGSFRKIFICESQGGFADASVSAIHESVIGSLVVKAMVRSEAMEHFERAIAMEQIFNGEEGADRRFLMRDLGAPFRLREDRLVDERGLLRHGFVMAKAEEGHALDEAALDFVLGLVNVDEALPVFGESCGGFSVKGKVAREEAVAARVLGTAALALFCFRATREFAVGARCGNASL